MSGSPVAQSKLPLPSYLAVVESLIHQEPTSYLYLGALRHYLQRSSSQQRLRSIQIQADEESSTHSNTGAATTDSTGTPWLILVEGLPAPATISELGHKYNLPPEIFLGHLDIERVLRKNPVSFELPLTPFVGGSAVHLSVSRLGTFNTSPFYETSIVEQQARADKHVLDVERALFDSGSYSRPRVRRLDIHNRQYFSVEHLITSTVGQNGTRVLFLDHNIPTEDIALMPWFDFEPARGRSPALLPIVHYRARQQHNANQEEARLETEVRRMLGDTFFSASHRGHLSLSDPFDLLHGIISATLASWAQILNMLERCNGPLETTPPHESLPALDQLRCNICFLGRLREHIGQCRSVVQNWGAMMWPDSSDAAGTTATSEDGNGNGNSDDDIILQTLQAHDFLLERCIRLQQSFQTTSQLLTSATQTLEAQRGLDQATRIEYLTKLAFFFIPLSFVSSVFGMNVAEIQTSNPPLWTFFVASIVVLIFAFGLLKMSESRWNLRARPLLQMWRWGWSGGGGTSPNL